MVLRQVIQITSIALFCAEAFALDYDVVAVKAPRYGDQTQTNWQEVANPATLEPGQDLVLVKRDGSEETLVACRSTGCSVVDPVMSLDGKSVYFSLYPDMRAQRINTQRGQPQLGADIYRMDLASRQSIRLTNGEFTPNSGVADWASTALGTNEPTKWKLGYGIMNLGPCPVPGDKPGEERIVFSSNRNGFVPARGLTDPNFQLFVMDANGKNVRHIGHFNLGSALHPTLLRDGRVMFASSEAQGVRDERLWGLWSVYPDGRHWEPLISAFTSDSSYHFQTQNTSGEVLVTQYYNLNNNGFGTLVGFPAEQTGNGPFFGSPNPKHSSNPLIQEGVWWFTPSHPTHLQPIYRQYAFSPVGLRTLTAFSHPNDEASSRTPSGAFAGKVTHPSGAPNNDILMVYSPGPVNDLSRPTDVPRVHGGIYLQLGSIAVNSPSALVAVKVDPGNNYQQPRAVLPYREIYGVDPIHVPYLPAGTTPFGIVGTASFFNRDTTPGFGSARFNGLDPFNTTENGASSNWLNQGAEAGLYSNNDIFAVRILAMEPSSHLSYAPGDGTNATKQFRNFARERLRILGELPLRKGAPGSEPLDGDGNPDTSFKARIPADVPFTFQTLDKNGMVLNMSQTWHQVRPGEQRYDCGGCHAHSKRATDMSRTVAGQQNYQPFDLADTLVMLTKNSQGQTVTASYQGADRKSRMNVEYLTHIKPLFQRSCVGCHTSKNGAVPAARLDLDNSTLVNGYEQTFLCLTSDEAGACGYAPVISSRAWRQTNASRWVRMFQSRRSLLAWKVFGARLDGWQNSSHPTESTPGNASTLPAGTSANDADLDYTGTIMPPPGSGVQPLSEDEKMTIARWIDLGAPGDRQGSYRQNGGWFVDDLRPTLNVSWPRAGEIAALGKIEFVAHDYYSGLNVASFTVTADFNIGGRMPGSNLAPLFQRSEYRWTLPVSEDPAQGTVKVTVFDVQGNKTVEEITFRKGNGTPLPPTPTTSPGSPTATPTSVPVPPTNTPVNTATPGATATSTPQPSATFTATPIASSTPTPHPKRPVIRPRQRLVVSEETEFRKRPRVTNVSSEFGPMTYTLVGVTPQRPSWLRFGRSSGTFWGIAGTPGTFIANFKVSNQYGTSAIQSFKIVVLADEELRLTGKKTPKRGR